MCVCVYTHTHKLMESILDSKPGGEHIIHEYNQTKSSADETRRKMVNILAADIKS